MKIEQSESQQNNIDEEILSPSEQAEASSAQTVSPQNGNDNSVRTGHAESSSQSTESAPEAEKPLKQDIQDTIQNFIDRIEPDKAAQKQNIENHNAVEAQYNAKTIIFMVQDMTETKASVEKFQRNREDGTGIPGQEEDSERPRYKLDDLREFHSFIKANKGTKPLAYAIVLSLFDVMPVKELVNTIDVLLNELPAPQTDENNPASGWDYLSQWEILNMLGGEQGTVPFQTYLGEIPFQCIKFSDDTDQNKVLEHIWSYFPNLRITLVEWLVEISHVKSKFLLNQVVLGLARLMTLDFGFGIEFILPGLQAKQEFALTGRLVIFLHQQPDQVARMDRLLLNWLSIANHPLWWLPYQIYIQQNGKDSKCAYADKIHKNIYSYIKEMIDGRNMEKGLEIVHFMGENITYSACMRDTTATMLRDMSAQIRAEEKYLKKNEQLTILALIYYSFLQASYQELDKQHMALGLVAYVTQDQFNCCKDVLVFLLSKSNLKSLLFGLLSQYLKEIDQYEFPAMHLFRYFRSLAFLNLDCYDSVQQFLDLLISKKCILAGEISQHIQDVRQKILENRKKESGIDGNK